MVEDCGIRYYPPAAESANVSGSNTTTSKLMAKSGRPKGSKRSEVASYYSSSRKRGRKSKTTAKAVEEEEEQELEQQIGEADIGVGGQRSLDLFKALMEELDAGIKAAMETFYAGTLAEFEGLLAKSTQAGLDLVPTLFVRGDCIDWDKLSELISESHPPVVIVKRNDHDQGHLEEAFRKLGKGQKLLILLDASKMPRGGDFIRMFKWIEERGSIYLVMRTSSSFASLYESISRDIVARMNINKHILPQCEHFLRQHLFANHIPLGFLRDNCVQIHGKTLAAALSQFQTESYSLSRPRKILALALLEFAARADKQQQQPTEELKLAVQKQGAYSTALNILAKMCSEDKLDLNCKIHGGNEFYENMKRNLEEKWHTLNRESWLHKLREMEKIICVNPLIDINYLTQCQELIEQLEKGKDENEPPRRKTIVSSSSRSLSSTYSRSCLSKSSVFFADQQRTRSKLLNPLSDGLRKGLISFLDDFFGNYLKRAKSIAGTDDSILLSPSLSIEIDAKLGKLAQELMSISSEGTQLDVCLTYYLLVTFDSDSNKIQLDKLRKSFLEQAKPIPELETEARFMAALSQLEYIGALKVVSESEGTVRLIYLPGGMLSNDLFRKN